MEVNDEGRRRELMEKIGGRRKISQWVRLIHNMREELVGKMEG